MAFHVVIVTPEQQILDTNVTQAILPAHDGQIGILTDRAPLLVKLGQGRLQLDLPGGQSQSFYVEGGIAQMKDNELTILTQMAIPAADIDVQAARAEAAEATAQRITDDKSFQERQRRLRRAQAMQELATRQ
jgi:F-type H+-transporting ATPase subunit epsilon